MSKVVLFRDKTAALDIQHMDDRNYLFWDNTKCARFLEDGDEVYITPTRGNYKTHEEWLEAPAMWGIADGGYAEIREVAGTWASGKGGYCHRHYLSQKADILVGDIADLEPEVFEALMDWKQGPVRYVQK
ncbi:MAG: hypothetical protein ACRC6V_19570 [Bacteroidales bacterium]